jgi:paraquat-inducible protein B
VENYKGLLGSGLYTYVSVHGSIAYAITKLARFSQNQGQQHWNALKRLFQYLKNCRKEGLLYEGDSLDIDAYVDASYSKEPRSITGYIVRIGGTAVIWRSKQQGVSTQSAMEAEYVGLSEVLKGVSSY